MYFKCTLEDRSGFHYGIPEVTETKQNENFVINTATDYSNYGTYINKEKACLGGGLTVSSLSCAKNPANSLSDNISLYCALVAASNFSFSYSFSLLINSFFVLNKQEILSELNNFILQLIHHCNYFTLYFLSYPSFSIPPFSSFSISLNAKIRVSHEDNPSSDLEEGGSELALI